MSDGISIPLFSGITKLLIKQYGNRYATAEFTNWLIEIGTKLEEEYQKLQRVDNKKRKSR